MNKTTTKPKRKRRKVDNRPGLWWHVHHEEVVEYCYDPKERRDYIKEDKPDHEIATRLRLMKRVKHVPAKLRPFVKAYEKATEEYNSGLGTWDKWNEANADLQDAIRDMSDRAITRWHNSECKCCPWTVKNGTIFPEEEG